MGSGTDTCERTKDNNDCDQNKKDKCNNESNCTLWTVLLVIIIIVLILVAIYLIMKMVMYGKIFSFIKDAKCKAQMLGNKYHNSFDHLSNKMQMWAATA